MQGLKECTTGDIFLCFTPCHDNFQTSLCDCPRTCKFTRFHTTVSQSQLPSRVAAQYLAQAANSSPDALREDYLEIRVYFDTMMVRYETHEPQFTFNSMFAYLGGQMGFFLGASLITLSELLETLFFTAYICLRKKLMHLGQLNRKSATSTAQPHTQDGNTSSNTHGLPVKPAW
ncbi:acid-sensing ion channel 4 [Elysia marginata]|uniref:Acid-sensing ion channel 4 n=1 Tax=Elysia marginata TaxID=1093978 RepID=A0AAV4FPK4_9GAST|nr:acid-sensing ion channel 4 [Elysia marginata]